VENIKLYETAEDTFKDNREIALDLKH